MPGSTKMKHKATLNDVARVSGLSRSMVSYVLNDFENCKAKETTKKRIMAAVKQLDYHFNPAARALRSGRSRQIGVIMPGPYITFYANMISFLQEELRKRNYTAIFGLWGDDPTERWSVAKSIIDKNNLDGIIAWDMEVPDPVGLRGLPAVFFAKYDSPQEYDRVDIDIESTMRQTLGHLTECGCRRIGYCGILHDPRAVALAGMLRETGLPTEPGWFRECTVDDECIRRSTEALCGMAEMPDALVFNNDLVAVTVCKLMQAKGIRLPAMLSLHDSALLRFNTPPITAFDTREAELAVALVDLIDKRLSRRNLPPTTINVPATLIVRESTCPVAKR